MFEIAYMPIFMVVYFIIISFVFSWSGRDENGFTEDDKRYMEYEKKIEDVFKLSNDKDKTEYVIEELLGLQEEVSNMGYVYLYGNISIKLNKLLR